MKMRALFAGVLTCTVISVLPMWAQEKPATLAGGGTFAQEVKGLTADDFAQREAAVQKLQGLIAEQIKQRAAIQDVVQTLQKELASQERSLAMVSDEEAQAQVAGLLEMERGLASWTIQTMAEPAEKRKALLAWGLGDKGCSIAAKVYSENKRTRLEGIKELAKIEDDGACWTLSRLINDNDPAIRAGAMAAAWSRKPTTEIVDAFWFRAVAGPMSQTDHRPPNVMTDSLGPDAGIPTIKVEVPDGEPMEFDAGDSASEFTDALLAGSVLVHLKRPEIGEKVKALVADRIKAGKTFTGDFGSDVTLVTHWLIEAYDAKEAVPILASEALAESGEQNMGELNGQMYGWTDRTIAIGTLGKLTGKDPTEFGLKHVHDLDGNRGWVWAVEADPVNMANPGPNAEEPDGAAIRSFYTWWKSNHATYGVKEEPSNINVPDDPSQPPRPRGGFPGFRGRPGMVQPGGPVQILPAPAGPGMAVPDGPGIPDAVPGAAPGAPGSTPPPPPADAAPDGSQSSPPIAPPPAPIVPSRNRPPIRNGAAG